MFDSLAGLIPGVGGAVGIAGAAFGIWKKRKLGNLVKAVFDVVKAYRSAKDASGAGGEEITKEEMDGLVEKLEVAAKSAVGVIRS